MTDAITFDASQATQNELDSITFPITDDELLLLLRDEPGALLKLYPEGPAELAPAVERAVKRSMVAHRVLMTLPGGELELTQPYVGLVDALTAAWSVVRITTDDDDQRARLVLRTSDAVFTVDRDPNGIHAVTITRLGTEAAVVAETIVHEAGTETDPALVGTAPVQLGTEALLAGRQHLARGDFAEAESALGDAYPLLVGASTVHRVESMHLRDGSVRGAELDLLDALDLGWVSVAYVPGDATQVIVRPLGDDALRATIEAIVAGPDASALYS